MSAVPGEGLYCALARSFPLIPIRSRPGLEHALRVAESLAVRHDLNAEEEEYLADLGDLIERYLADCGLAGEIGPVPQAGLWMRSLAADFAAPSP